MNAQGEDVCAGIRTPQTIDQLKEQNPEVYDQFYKIVYTLEKHYKDMQDMEFTIEEGKLYSCRQETEREPLPRSEDCLRPGGRRHDHRRGSCKDDRPETA
jgi:phosphoenolpyruvate synthase/pyruvate phosphate dikinase